MNNLEKIRAEKGLTLEALSKKAGLSKQRVGYVEKHKINPMIARKLANALDENVFNVLGLDALTMLPETKEEKDALLKIVRELEV